MSLRPPAHTFRTSDRVAISFELHAARSIGAPRLVLIHPLALNGTIWDQVIGALAGRAEVLTYDCRGHGSSERKTMPFTIDMFARDLAELLEHVGWEIATIAGCSLGGCVAQAFAGMHSERLNALGLIDTTAWYGPDAAARWRERAVSARASGLSGMTEFQVSRWFSDEFRVKFPALVREVSSIFVGNDIGCYCAACHMLGEVDLRPLQSSIRVPTAVIVGRGDYATPVTMSRQIHESISGSTLRILPRVRHLTPVEAPQDVAAELLELLGRTE